MATAFNSMGATPSAPQIGPSSLASLQKAGVATTPVAKALNSASGVPSLSMANSKNTVQPINVNSNTAVGSSTPTGLSMQTPPPVDFSQVVSTAGLIPKKQTITTASGDSHTTEYHPPSEPVGKTPEQLKAEGAPTDPTVPQPQQQSTQNQTTQQYSQTNPATYPGLVNQLASTSSGPSADYLKQQQEANQYNEALKKSREDQAQAIANIEGSPHTMNFAQGAENVIRNQYLAQQQALGSAFQGASTLQGAANTQQGLQQTGLTSAAGLAAPQLAGFNQQAFNPISGQFSGGQSLNDAVSNVVQKLKDGTMSYADAQTALSGYGQGGINALQQALPQGFNVAQSNTLAGQQGSIGPAYTYAKTALTNLQSAVGGLMTGQGTNIPIINAITQGLSTTFGVGSEGVQAYKGALAEARSAVQKVLASVSGGTPTDYVGQSMSLLPDNATPNQINAAISTLDTLGAAKVGIYGNPGASGSSSNTNQNANTTSNSIYSF